MDSPRNILKNRYPALTDAMLDEFIGMAQIKMLDAGEIFLAAGDTSSNAALILQGLMRNYITRHDGREVTVHFAAEMEVIAPYSMLMGMPASETTAAVESSVLLVVDFAAFKQWITLHPDVQQMYIEVIEKKLVETIRRVEDFTMYNPEQRYQRLINQQPHLINRVPLKFLASYLGITQVSLSRVRKRVAGARN